MHKETEDDILVEYKKLHTLVVQKILCKQPVTPQRNVINFLLLQWLKGTPNTVKLSYPNPNFSLESQSLLV